MRIHNSSRLSRRTCALAATAVAALGTGLFAATPAHGSISASITVSNGVVTVFGSDAADAMDVKPKGEGALSFDLGNGTDPTVVNVADIQAVNVFLGAGNDAFAFNAGLAAGQSLTVNGGRGDDTITGSAGNDLLIGGAGNDTVLGGAGNDTIHGNGGNDIVNGNQGNDTEFLGSGNDTALWVPGEASDVVEGESGTDTLSFKARDGADDPMLLVASGERVRLVHQVLPIVMDFNDVETLDLDTGSREDAVDADDLSGTDLTRVNLNMGTRISQANEVIPDSAADRLTVQGTPAAETFKVDARGSDVVLSGGHTRYTVRHTQAQFDRLAVLGGGGNDAFSVTSAASALIAVSFSPVVVIR